MLRHLPALSFLLLSCISPSTRAYAQDLDDLAKMDFESLLGMKVTSLSRQEELGFEASAALYVITQETIRSSGYNTIPELLRLVPGFNVARTTSSDWAIASRGFNGTSSNKLLVLMNGRTLYAPVFAGTFWEVQDTPLEDIERIEVIRGPGATMWGSNAVNGIVNIITKDAAATNGWLASGGGGSHERAFVTLRKGFNLSEESNLRVYSKLNDHADHEDPSGKGTGDKWNNAQLGFEYDIDKPDDRIETEGRLFQTNANSFGFDIQFDPLRPERIRNDTKHSGGHWLSKWTHRLSATSDTSLQFYLDNNNRDTVTNAQMSVTIYDVEFQHHTKLGETQDVLWGLTHRLYDDKIISSRIIEFFPTYRKQNLSSVFFQDKIDFQELDLNLTLGLKLERNDFTGIEHQPNVRLSWSPNDSTTAWAAWSRAVRVPMRTAQGSTALAGFVGVLGTNLELPFGVAATKDNLEGEDLYATEFGLRLQDKERASLDASCYWNHYENLLGLEVKQSADGLGVVNVAGRPVLTALAIWEHQAITDVFGLELTGNVRFTPWWQMEASYWLTKVGASSVSNPDIIPVDNKPPKHNAVVRSQVDILEDFEFDTILRYVDSAPPVQPFAGSRLPSYVQLDVRLGWQMSDSWEASILGRNLLDASQLEFIDELHSLRIENPRGIFGKITWTLG